MTDLEMTKLCWKAITGLENDLDPAYVYDPLHDDAQAMALVKKFELSVLRAPLSGWVVTGGFAPGIVTMSNTDINRAIVECVAQMQLNRTKSAQSGGQTELKQLNQAG